MRFQTQAEHWIITVSASEVQMGSTTYEPPGIEVGQAQALLDRLAVIAHGGVAGSLVLSEGVAGPVVLLEDGLNREGGHV